MCIKKSFITGLFFVSHAAAVTKMWKNDWDINNPSNWEGGKPKPNCDGLSFDSTYPINVVVDQLDVKKIYLPKRGTIKFLDDAVITINENSSDIMNCVTYREPNHNYYWMNYDNWFLESVENVAVPHKERLPCEHDDVLFPKGWKSSPCIIETDNIKIKSFKFGNNFLDSEDLRELYNSYVDVTNEPCTDATGCPCGNERNNEMACAYVNPDTNLQCLEAIKPTGFCSEICGASVVFQFRADFRIENIRTSLATYSSDTHVSKVRNDSGDVIQVVFAEKEFSGTSVEEGKRFYSLLKSDDSFGATNILLYTSSSYIPVGYLAGNPLSLVLGTLCGVLLTFAIFFFLYAPPQAVVRARQRLRFSTPLSFKTNLFARFENTENAGLIIGETHSLGGSILSLDKVFENPMYGKSTPSTASTSYDTVASTDVNVTRSEISVENPMYDLNNMDMGHNVEDVGEQGELIDLTKKDD